MKTQALVIACALLMACGDKDKNHSTGGKTNGAILSISLSPTSVTLIPGNTATVTISITRGTKLAGASVSISLSSAPDGVVATLDSSATTADTATITLSTSLEAGATTGSITVTAQALALDPDAIASAPLAIAVGARPTITVTGRVVTADMIPISGASVSVYNHGSQTPQTVSTNTSGNFTATNVVAPYDAKIAALGPSGVQALWLGLTRLDPLLSALAVQQGPIGTAEVQLSFSGGQGAASASLPVAFTIACPDAAAQGDADLAVQSKPLEGAITAGGQTCTVNALQHHPASGVPDALSSGTAVVTPNPSGTVDTTIALTNLDLHDVAVSAVTESGNSLSHAQMIWHNQTRAVQLSDVTDSADGYSATVHAPADESLGVIMVFNETSGNAQSNVVSHLSSAVTTLDVTVPEPPSVVSPASGLIDPTSASFTINGASGAGYIYFIGSNPGDQQLYIASMDESLPATTLADHGMALESTQSYHWQFYTFAGIASADDLASTKATLTGYMDTDGGSYSISVPGSFTTP